MSNRSAIASGRLRHRIQFAAPNLSQDAAGGVDFAAADVFATVPASVESDAGSLRQIFAARQIVGENYFIVTVRWLEGITNSMMIWWEGRTFRILQIENPDGRRKVLRIFCVERDQSLREPGLAAP